METYALSHFITGDIPFSPEEKFSAECFFNPDLAPQALLSMAYYSGYLSFKYPKHELHGDVLVAPNDDMRDIFMTAVLDSLPGHYKTMAKELMRQGVSLVVAVSKVYKAYVAATLQ